MILFCPALTCKEEVKDKKSMDARRTLGYKTQSLQSESSSLSSTSGTVQAKGTAGSRK